jgi:hypothetical protein
MIFPDTIPQNFSVMAEPIMVRNYLKGMVVNNLGSRTNFIDNIYYENIEQYAHIGGLFVLTRGQEITF